MQQSTPTVFFNIQMNYVYINTITFWFTISVIKAKTNSQKGTSDTRRQRHQLPRTTDLHKEI